MTLDNIESYFRRLRLKVFFIDAEEEEDDADVQFRPTSTWMPPKGRDIALETYIRKVTNRQAIKTRDNLLPKERSALKNLQ